MIYRIQALLMGALLLLAASSLSCSAWANEAVPEGEAAPVSHLISLHPLFMPVLRDHRVTKYLVLQINLEPAPGAQTATIRRNLPRVHDALLREVYLIGKEIAAEKVDLDALRVRLMQVIEASLGPDQISELYFAGVSEMRL